MIAYIEEELYNIEAKKQGQKNKVKQKQRPQNITKSAR